MALFPSNNLKGALRFAMGNNGNGFAELMETVRASVGDRNGTTVKCIERGWGPLRQTQLIMTATPITLADDAGVVAYGGVKIYDFPAGALWWLGSTTSISRVTKSSAGVNTDWDGDFALGTATAGTGATLTGTEADLLPSTSTPQAVAGVMPAVGGQTTTALSAVIFDGTATAKDCFFNILVDDADHDVTTTPCNLLVTAVVNLFWLNLGDY